MIIQLINKICSECKNEKSISEFPKDKTRKDGFYPVCKSCNNERTRIYRNTETGKLKERSRKLKSNYGLSIEDWQILFNKQNGCCAICGVHQSKLAKALSTDHNHKTGKIRSLLCIACNLAVDYVEDKIDLLVLCKIYLSAHNDPAN